MHSRFPSHFTAAVSAVALILITAGISMVMFMMIAHPVHPVYSLRLSYLYSRGNSLAMAVGMVIFGAYCAGTFMWILLFAMHRAGTQRLSSLQTIVRR